jgi:hypothetical protein
MLSRSVTGIAEFFFILQSYKRANNKHTHNHNLSGSQTKKKKPMTFGPQAYYTD